MGLARVQPRTVVYAFSGAFSLEHARGGRPRADNCPLSWAARAAVGPKRLSAKTALVKRRCRARASGRLLWGTKQCFTLMKPQHHFDAARERDELRRDVTAQLREWCSRREDAAVHDELHVVHKTLQRHRKPVPS
jgi:hypothetical protein